MSSLLLAAFQFLADHPKWLGVPILTTAVSLTIMNRLMGPHRIMPDLSFGFTPQDIRELHETWAASDGSGDDGCQAYVRTATLDLFPYMESYAVVLGTLLVWVCRRHSLDERWATFGWAVMLCDVGETLILRQACLSVVSDQWLQVASLMNRAKWVALVVTCVTILAAFRLPRRRPRRRAGRAD